MKNVSIIFHSGFYDRVHHGLSIALSALLMGGKARLYFTHASLKYVKKGAKPSENIVVEGDEHYAERYISNLKEGHIEELEEVIKYCKDVGAEIYVCPASMAMLNISRDELIDEVDEVIGLSDFINRSKDFDLIFI